MLPRSHRTSNAKLLSVVGVSLIVDRFEVLVLRGERYLEKVRESKEEMQRQAQERWIRRQQRNLFHQLLQAPGQWKP